MVGLMVVLAWPIGVGQASEQGVGAPPNYLSDLVFYKKDGKLAVSDLSFEQRGDQFVMDKARYTAEVPVSLKPGTALTYRHGNHSLSFAPANLEKEVGGQAVTGEVRWENALGVGASLGARAHRGGLQKVVEIESVEAALALSDGDNLSLPFVLTTEDDTEIWGKFGGVEQQKWNKRSTVRTQGEVITIKRGEEESFIRPARAWDSGDGEIEIEVELVERDGQLIFTKYIPTDWLADATYPVYTDADITFGAEVVFESAATSDIAVASLSDTKVVIAYNDEGNDNSGTAVVGTISGSDISFGAPEIFLEGGGVGVAVVDNITVTALDSTNVVVAYTDASVGLSSVALGIVSDTTISFADSADFDGDDYLSVITLDSTRFLIAYAAAPAFNNAGWVVAGSASGGTISVGTASTFNTDTETTLIKAAALSSSKAVVAFGDGGNSDAGTALVVNVSGTSISSFGPGAVFESSAVTDVAITALDSTHILVVWGTGGGSGKAEAAVGTISGDSVSFGTTVEVDADNFANNLSVVTLDADSVVVTYTDNQFVYGGKSVLGTISGTSVSFGTAVAYEDGLQVPLATSAALDDENFVVAYRDTSNGTFGTAVVGSASGAGGGGGGGGDVVDPTVTSLSPADNATGVGRDTNLVITFSEEVNAVSGDVVIKKSSDDSTVEAIDVLSNRVSGSGTDTITLNPDVTLAQGTGYYVTIDATAFDDSSGNSYAGISDTGTWNFATAGNAPTATKPSELAQVLSDEVSFKTTLSDVDGDVTRLKVEYSTDGSSWKKATVGSVVASRGELIIDNNAAYQIQSVDTDGGAVALTVNWLAGDDLENKEATTVYVRVTPNDGSVDGNRQTSDEFLFSVVEATDGFEEKSPGVTVTTTITGGGGVFVTSEPVEEVDEEVEEEEESVVVTDDEVIMETRSASDLPIPTLPVLESASVAWRLAALVEPVARGVSATMAVVAAVGLLASANLVTALPSLANGLTTLYSRATQGLLALAGFQKRREPWGRVVDAKTGRGLPGAIVLIIDTAKQKVMDTVTTGSDGSFSSLVPPGTYDFQVRKTGWEVMPDAPVPQKRAGEQVYAGRPITVTKEAVVDIILPLKPEGEVLGHQLVWQMLLQRTQLFLHYLSWPLLGLGLLLSTVALLGNPSVWNITVEIIYVVMIASKFWVEHLFKQAVGKVVDSNTGKSLDLTMIRLYDAASGRMVATEVATRSGSFLLRVAPGVYTLMATRAGYEPYREAHLVIRSDKYPLAKTISLTPA